MIFYTIRHNILIRCHLKPNCPLQLKINQEYSTDMFYVYHFMKIDKFTEIHEVINTQIFLHIHWPITWPDIKVSLLVGILSSALWFLNHWVTPCLGPQRGSCDEPIDSSCIWLSFILRRYVLNIWFFFPITMSTNMMKIKLHVNEWMFNQLLSYYFIFKDMYILQWLHFSLFLVCMNLINRWIMGLFDGFWSNLLIFIFIFVICLQNNM